MDFIVSTLADSGLGSLRSALEGTNSLIGFDNIWFASNLAGGTVSLARALPTITDRVSLNGIISSTGSPQIGIDFNNNKGLIFKEGSGFSSLTGFSLGDASGDGVTLKAGGITIQNNYIGVALDGVTGIANRGNGIFIDQDSGDNLIGTLDALTGIPLAQQVSNVISANRGNGIQIRGADNNRIANNRIGTSADGTTGLGNDLNGVLLDAGANRNTLGGNSTEGGNNPTGDKGATTPTIVRPPQGNLISGNGLNGVLIKDRSQFNILSGNFIGTNSGGIAPIGNMGDGVSILKSDNNSLLGTYVDLQPFVFYNVVSGNGGNGLRVTDSNAITVHANFFGLGADNATIVANGGNGALIEGNSTNIVYGGVIPLGNVNAGNKGNGIEVKDSVSGFKTVNTFGGSSAFFAPAPNGKDGILISATGGNNIVQTNLFSANLGNGIRVTGRAKGVTISPNFVGLGISGLPSYTSASGGPTLSWANGLNGILIDGSASDITIAGNQTSIVPQNTISNNSLYGIRIIGKAKNILINNTYVGLSANGTKLYGNKLGGLYVGPDTSGVVIGSKDSTLINKFNGNGGAGITLDRANGVTLINSRLDSNLGSGLLVLGGRDNRIVGNTASFNSRYGFEFLYGGWISSLFKRNIGVGNTLGLTNI